MAGMPPGGMEGAMLGPAALPPEMMPPELAEAAGPEAEAAPGQEELAAPNVQTTDQSNPHRVLIDNIRKDNLADGLNDDAKRKISELVHRGYDIDETSRSDWVETNTKGFELAMQVATEKSYPWPKASNVIFPLITSAALQFGARAYPVIVQNRNVVKGVVWGDDSGVVQPGPDGQPMVAPPEQGGQPVWAVPPGAKAERARRVGEHMSWQFLTQMPEWEEGTDYLLHALPIAGSMFRKTYYSNGIQRNCSHVLMPMALVVNYKTKKALDDVPRITEIVSLNPHQLEELIAGGMFLDGREKWGKPEGNDDDADDEFLEQHRWLDLDEDGFSEPYVVTTHKRSKEMTRLVARYDEDGVHIDPQSGRVRKIEPVHHYTKYDFLPNPEGGFYGLGFGRLLGPINDSINTSINMMLDAAHQQIAGGGFVGKGMSMHSGAVRFKMGEYKVINVPGATIRDSVVPMQFPGPSEALFGLLGTLIEAGKEIGSIKDVLTGEMTAATMQPTTLLALIEQGSKVSTGTYKRVHRAFGKEAAKVFRLNRRNMEQVEGYQQGEDWKEIKKEDYAKAGGVEPVSDPAMISDAQRMGRAQFLMTFMNDPLHNQLELRKRIHSAAQTEKPDDLLVTQPPPDPALEAAGIELEIKAASARAKQINDLASAVEKLASAELHLAEASIVPGKLDQSWAKVAVDRLKAQAIALVDGGEEAPEPPDPIDGEAMDDEPPIPGARRARDGKWYVEDEERPGRFLMAVRG